MCTIPYKMVNLKNQNNSKKLNKNYESTNYHILMRVSYDPKLCCGKEDDAFYIGTHFIDLYRDYLLLE